MAAETITEFKVEFHSLGRIAFEAYNEAGANPGKTFDGRPVPTWEALTDDVRAKWEAGAAATFEQLRAAGKACHFDPEERAELDSLIATVLAHGLPSKQAIAELTK